MNPLKWSLVEPFYKLMIGEDRKSQLNNIIKMIGLPIAGLVVFLFIWQGAASHIHTSLGQFPGPIQTYEQFISLQEEAEASAIKEEKFYERQAERNAQRVEKDPSYEPTIRDYTGPPTFFEQIGRSLVTVMSGFILASIIAIPIGIIIGLSANAYAAVNPLIQIFKPVSPLAWLPLVTMVVSAVYVTDDPAFDKAFLNSMFTVLLCCLWPTIINTAAGVATVTQDLKNVSQVLRLNWWTHVRKIVLPCSIPMMFTGLRISLGIAWMVLIAAEMLAQNPGLGKFVWDEFQNGSSNSLGRIMVAVIMIGIVGFILDRGMLVLQKAVSWDKSVTLR
ncbi:Bicarbonate transport system permease protein CmpB [Hydrogenovibrio crunogenus]|uniref:Bicarbonate transport system permease protein CmpB n=1 Tax=Hydrogenovibrio crunogenus TaxID=39765 RepID=A0A4P7NZC1_9GAMM|nr:ABC transporter permease [Hydrogenovibrio crunogenus]QBZ83181.1 Bicarbonate transport system permease protein CmpB [Hydrogenovibrio crunogenus]